MESAESEQHLCGFYENIRNGGYFIICSIWKLKIVIFIYENIHGVFRIFVSFVAVFDCGILLLFCIRYIDHRWKYLQVISS